MSAFLPSFYGAIQRIKSLETELAHHLWIKSFCPQALRATAAEELDEIYQIALLGDERLALKQLVQWLELRHCGLKRLTARPFYKRLVPWRTIQELNRTRKQLMSWESLLVEPLRAEAPEPVGLRQTSAQAFVAILQTDLVPLGENLKGVSTLLQALASERSDLKVLTSEDLLTYLKDEDAVALSALLIPSQGLPAELMEPLQALKARGVKLISDDSVIWSLPSSSVRALRRLPSSLLDATFTAYFREVFPQAHAAQSTTYYTPPLLNTEPLQFDVADKEERRVDVVLVCASPGDLIKLSANYQSVCGEFSQVHAHLLRDPWLDEASWQELQAFGAEHWPSLQGLESLDALALQPGNLVTLLSSDNFAEGAHLMTTLLMHALSCGCQVMLPSKYVLAVDAATRGDADIWDTGSLKNRLNAWLNHAGFRQNLNRFWRHYIRGLQDPWLAAQRALLALDTISKTPSGSALQQVAQLNLATWKTRMPDHGAFQVIRRYQKPDSKPAISVLVTNYNYEGFILETLEALRQQTFKSFEIVVVDDRSTDRSMEVLEAWMAENHEHFEGLTLLLNEENSGPSVGRNHAVLMSRAPLLFIQDADNPILPECLEKLHQALLWNTPFAFAYPTLERFGTLEGFLSDVEWNPLLLGNQNHIDTMSLIRASALSMIHSYRRDLKGWEDYDLWCQFASRGFLGTHVREVLARYRAHPKNISHSHTAHQEVQAEMRRIMKREHAWLS